MNGMFDIVLYGCVVYTVATRHEKSVNLIKMTNKSYKNDQQML